MRARLRIQWKVEDRHSNGPATVPTDLTTFASEGHPLRCSSLPLLVRCPWRAVMLFTDLVKDAGGAAADTGSAAHHAIQQWHLNEGDSAAAVASMRAAVADFPLADLHEAELHFQPYTQDPRNTPEAARLVAVEARVTFTLAPHDSDPTQEPIYVNGTLDQLRRGDDGRIYLWDVKTGQPEGWAMLHNYALQIAAYCVGAKPLVGEDVHPGGIIRTRGWRKRGVDPKLAPPGVFFHTPFDLAHCNLLLDGIRLVVAQIRAGEVNVGPGDWCSYCPSGGLQDCLTKLVSLL